MRTLRRSFTASILLLLIIGCKGDSPSPTAPTAPPPPPNAKGFIWGHVVEQSGVCIVDAVVEIVEGSDAGKKVVQKEKCSVWDDFGFMFDDLPLGKPIKLRATKEGYQPKEVETLPITGGRALDIVLLKQ
jgi:hypothetical protein